MPTTPTTPTVQLRPTLLILSAVVGLLAVLTWAASITMTVLDANHSPDLPDTLINLIGRIAGTTTVIAVVALAIYTIRRSSNDNARAAVEAVTAARIDLKSDTGELHGLAAAMRHPEIIVVRQGQQRFQKMDRAEAMRLVGEAEAQGAPMAQTAPDITDETWRAFVTGWYARDKEFDGGPDSVA